MKVKKGCIIIKICKIYVMSLFERFNRISFYIYYKKPGKGLLLKERKDCSCNNITFYIYLLTMKMMINYTKNSFYLGVFSFIKVFWIVERSLNE